MPPINGYLEISPLQKGALTTAGGNEYLIVDRPRMYFCAVGQDVKLNDTVIVEEINVITVNVAGKPKYFVKEDMIIAIIPREDSPIPAETT